MYIRTSRLVIDPKFKIEDGYPQINPPQDVLPDIINMLPSMRNAFVGYLPNSSTEVCHISLERIDSKYEVHYGTEPMFRGKHYMSEALPVAINWLFANSRIEMLYARIGDNPPSEHLLIKNGFVRVEEKYPKDGMLYKLEKGQLL